MIRFFKQREVMLLAIIAIIVALVTTRSSGFGTPRNLAAVFNDTAVLAMLACGQLLVILTRSIDLSVAANLALTGMIAAMINAAMPGVPVEVLIVGCVVVGGLLGAFNGVLVWKLNIPPIVVTLGTLTIYRGAVFLVSGGTWVNAVDMSDRFKELTRLVFLGLPMLSWFAIVVIALFVLLMARTSLGRSFYAAGINPTAATYAGIDVGKTKFIAFTISGMVAGLAGYLWVSRYVIASVDVARGLELQVVAACVIGGVSIAGGIGTVGGAVLGALFLGVINNALPVIGVSPFWQMAISGAAIITAVIFNARGERKRGRIILKSAEAA
ncbi:branched-chain amino acid ABC transporter permease [Devosia geojensis]|uniref:Branched-chain amino acid ABC transporter permease n=1 Tax=Devosia geojensis TaxID=443610 RepID=A0A0F5FTB6_9HYPH|nr:ABC transporter permease [Devosia geojensis]KKB12099.1 branched-chain amino acid ABC transporter permease [Devosia geojensis]